MTDDWQNRTPSPAPEPESRDVRSYITWSAAHVIAGIIAAIFLVVAISSLVLPVESEYGDKSPEFYFASALSSILWDISFVLVVFALVWHSGGAIANVGLRLATFVRGSVIERMTQPRNLKVLLLGLAGYGLAYLSVMFYGVLVELTGASFLEPSEQLPDGIFDNSFVVAATGVAVVIAAPIAEEILFRGFFFGGMRRYLSFWPAALFTGSVFSLSHFNIGLIIPFTLVGIVLAWSYERSNSLYTAILVHFLFNFTSFSILVLLPEAR